MRLYIDQETAISIAVNNDTVDKLVISRAKRKETSRPTGSLTRRTPPTGSPSMNRTRTFPDRAGGGCGIGIQENGLSR